MFFFVRSLFLDAQNVCLTRFILLRAKYLRLTYVQNLYVCEQTRNVDLNSGRRQRGVSARIQAARGHNLAAASARLYLYERNIIGFMQSDGDYCLLLTCFFIVYTADFDRNFAFLRMTTKTKIL